jgi:hypothetical protein
MPSLKINWLKTASGLGVTMLSICSSTAKGRRGVGVIVGVSVTDGVRVMVGVRVIVGVSVIDGVMVTVGVCEAVGVGGKKL